MAIHYVLQESHPSLEDSCEKVSRHLVEKGGGGLRKESRVTVLKNGRGNVGSPQILEFVSLYNDRRLGLVLSLSSYTFLLRIITLATRRKVRPGLCMVLSASSSLVL